MFEYQGWATILASYYEDEALEDKFNSISRELISEVNNISREHFECGIKYFNGLLRCWFIGFSNHKPKEWEEILDFYYLLSKKAPGSYGILSYRDDEDEYKNNEFRVFLLKKGNVIEVDDELLSPCIPEIEEI